MKTYTSLGEDEINNRFGYHRATAESAPRHAAVREVMMHCATHIDALIPNGRDKSLAFTALQEAMHWANSAIAMQNDVDTETAHLPNVATSKEPSEVARRFHEIYESLAPKFNYTTREASAVPWDHVPENNKNLMVAVAQQLVDEGTI